MQTNDTIDSWSGGRVGIRTGTVSYYLASSGIVTIPANGMAVQVSHCQDPGIDAGASSFRHPGKKGILIAVLQDTLNGLTYGPPVEIPVPGRSPGGPGRIAMFESTGRTSKRLICPFMSDSKGMILCQEANCAAAYPCAGIGESTWACAVIDGPGPQPER